MTQPQLGSSGLVATTPGPTAARVRCRFGELGRASLVARLFAAAACVAGHVSVASAQLEQLSRELADVEAKAQQLVREPIRRSQLRSPTYVEERLADGELHYRLKDYLRASIMLTDLVQNHASHPAFPDALFLLAESLFKAGDHLGARRRYEQLLGQGHQLRFRPYVQKTLGRLIEIAIHTHDFRGVEEYFTRLSQIPASEVEAATHYFRAKYLYSRAVLVCGMDGPELEQAAGSEGSAGAVVDQDALEQARAAFSAVAPGSPYAAQARYFIGVIYTLRGQYAPAIDAFRRALEQPGKGESAGQVVELSQLALGRLYYETNQLNRALEAYQRVQRTSNNFDAALFEVAWVHIRQGNWTDAERALELLSVARPDSRFIPDGKVLRGNLLLRQGRYQDAAKAFRSVAAEFAPVRKELDDILALHADPAVYFRELVRENMSAFDAEAFLPPLALRWTSFEAGMGRALEVVSDLSTTRQLISETRDTMRRLERALGAPNPLNLFSDLRGSRERSVGLRNRMTSLRSLLIELVERQSGDAGAGELGQVRARRREVDRLIGGMPQRAADFRARNAGVLSHYQALEQALSELDVQLLGLDARVTATKRFLEDSQPGTGSGAAAYTGELARHRAAIKLHQERVKELKAEVEAGRLRVGVGDPSYQKDVALRREYRGLVERERALLAQYAPSIAAQADSLFRRVAAVENALDAHDARLQAVVAERINEMNSVLRQERANIDRYRERMTELQGEAEGAVGGVTYANFQRVRRRFYDLVLRADVGEVDVAWAQREEHRTRAEMLTRERAREMKVLDDEFRELMDESGGKGEGS